MIVDNEENMRLWLKLTPQQFDIVKIIYKLRNRGLQPTPKNIQKEYKIEYNKYLMKPNLFAILRILIQKNVISKKGTADYLLHENGIRQIIGEARLKLDAEYSELERTQKEVDQFFKELTYKRETPDINYLEDEDIYKRLGEIIDESTIFYVVSDFPQISYTPEMTHALGRQPYTEKLWKKINKQDIHVEILTTLDVDILFNHAFRAYEDPKTAYAESATIINRLKTQVKKHKNLDIRYSPEPSGLDVAISETKAPKEFMIFTRDEHNDIQGGINIKSRKTSSNALKTFKKTYNYSTPLNKKQGTEIITQTQNKLKNKYGILND